MLRQWSPRRRERQVAGSPATERPFSRDYTTREGAPQAGLGCGVGGSTGNDSPVIAGLSHALRTGVPTPPPVSMDKGRWSTRERAWVFVHATPSFESSSIGMQRHQDEIGLCELPGVLPGSMQNLTPGSGDAYPAQRCASANGPAPIRQSPCQRPGHVVQCHSEHAALGAPPSATRVIRPV